MKIYQMTPSISHGDAVSNDVLAIDAVIRQMGIPTGIYAESVAEKVKGRAASWSEMAPQKEDILIYHQAIGNDMCLWLKDFPCRKIMVYHNITPPHFFREYSKQTQWATAYGLECTRKMASYIDYCLADSEFNKQDLLRMGYTCPIDVRPVLIPYEDYRREPDAKTLEKYDDDFINILFVGRVAPHKKQEDIIRAFCYYHRNLNPKSRLFLVGSDGGMENYSEALREYARDLGLEDAVLFRGHVSFPEILAYYHLADLFLCMSEHEGFCVPLIEAMLFDVPVMAYESTAIPYTLGGRGILLKDKNPVFVGKLMERVLQDPSLKARIIAGQARRLEDFSYDNVRTLLVRLLQKFMAQG